MKGTRTPQKRSRKRQMSGVYRAMRALRVMKGDVLRALDGRTTFGKAMAEEQRALIEHLGGDAVVSSTQRASVRVMLSLAMLIDQAMSYVIEQDGGVVNRRKRALYPVVGELAGLLSPIGR
jgi:hypothetical protein